MKSLRFIIPVVAVLLAAAPATAQVEIADWDDITLFLKVDTVGTFQALSQDDVIAAQGSPIADIDPGFQTAWGNLGIGAQIGENDEIEMFFDLYIASRPHPSETYGHQGYIIVRDMPGSLKRLTWLDRLFDHVDVKVGHFLINYGDHLHHRSDNAVVQDNPLIGNFVIDPELVAVGGEIYSEPGLFNWMVGISSGTTTEDWTTGRGTGLHGKVWVVPTDELRASVSYFQVDHSDNSAIFRQGTSAAFFTANRSGERYGGVWGGGNQPGQVTPRGGQDVEAYQIDLTWDGMPVKLYGHWGTTTDSDLNGSAEGTPKETWDYYAAQAEYYFRPNFYAAARYSAAAADMINNTPSNGTVARYQAGLGYWVNQYILGKLEYVYETMDDFESGIIVSGVDASKGPSFSGPVLEVSLAF